MRPALSNIRFLGDQVCTRTCRHVGNDNPPYHSPRKHVIVSNSLNGIWVSEKNTAYQRKGMPWYDGARMNGRVRYQRWEKLRGREKKIQCGCVARKLTSIYQVSMETTSDIQPVTRRLILSGFSDYRGIGVSNNCSITNSLRQPRRKRLLWVVQRIYRYHMFRFHVLYRNPVVLGKFTHSAPKM